MNNVVIKENVHEDNRKAAKTWLLIFYATLNSCILRIRPLQNERQHSVNHFWSSKSGNVKVTRLMLDIMKVLAAFIGNGEIYMQSAPSWQRVSTERQQFMVL